MLGPLALSQRPSCQEMQVIDVIDQHAAERPRIATDPQTLQDIYGLSGDLPFCYTPGSNPLRYWPPNYFYPTNDSTLCLVVFADIGGKDLNHLSGWEEYLPGGAWDRLVLWAEKGGSFPATELRMLGRVVSDYMNWLDSFGVLPRSSAGLSLQISEWNVWHLTMTNDRFKLKLGKDLLIVAIGPCNKEGRKAIKGAAVAAYAKALEIHDCIDKPAGPEAIQQFREFWNSVDAYSMAGVQAGKDFHRLLAHGKTDKWLLEQRDWAAVNPQMFIDASEVVLRAKEEARLKAAQLDEQRAMLQLMQAETLRAQKEKDVLQQEKEDLKKKLRDAKKSSADKLTEKISRMEEELGKKTDELRRLQTLGKNKEDHIRSEEQSLQEERDQLSQAVERLQRQLQDQESSWQEKLNIEKHQWTATERNLETAKSELVDTLRELRRLRDMDRDQVEKAEAARPLGTKCLVT